MKTFFIKTGLLIATLLYAPLALADPAGGSDSTSAFTPLIDKGIPGLTDTAITNSAGFATFFNNLYAYLIGAAVILAVIMIVWGGLEYSTQDSVSKKSDGKSKIYNALFGLVLVLSPALVFSIINPEILKLNVNFPPLHTTWGNNSLLNPDLTPDQQQVCAGYTKFQTAVVPSGQFCKDTLGAGWVSIGGDTNCTTTAIPSGSTLCGYNSSFDNSGTIKPSTPASGYYTDKSSISSGSWCYQTQGNDGYNCGVDQTSCQSLVSSETEGTTITNDCSKY